MDQTKKKKKGAKGKGNEVGLENEKKNETKTIQGIRLIFFFVFFLFLSSSNG